jgi:NarL family two-component system response regulator LiaR
MSASQPIRVLIVDDHAMVRSGLRQFVETFDDLLLAGEARNGAEAVAFCMVNPPDVVLMDLFMPVMDGSEATRQIIRHNPDIKIVALTNFQEQDLVEQALQAGAISYLLKNITADALAETIRSAHSGHSTLSPEAVEALVKMTRHKKGLGSDLTERELEVLELLVAGFSNAQIAERLSISITTVKFHVGGILSKLGVKSRSQAIALVWQNKLVEK